ncbi:malate synthase-like protein [Pavlovales sp. CCMP2436]|nr:malate synthase-like protein [Pavlovales sp. CCMP2436]
MLSSALRQTSRALARAPPLPALGALGGARGMALSAYVTISTGIEVDRELKRIVDEVIIPGTGVAPELFWRGFAEIVIELGPRNRAELDVRDRLQKQIDAWHVERRGQPHQHKEYRAFLEQIGYILESTSDKPVQITTEHVDTEIATLAGPQLHFIVNANAYDYYFAFLLDERFIVNAANARWGSLLDALYGNLFY